MQFVLHKYLCYTDFRCTTKNLYPIILFSSGLLHLVSVRQLISFSYIYSYTVLYFIVLFRPHTLIEHNVTFIL